jgi:hypothetical protein
MNSYADNLFIALPSLQKLYDFFSFGRAMITGNIYLKILQKHAVTFSSMK